MIVHRNKIWYEGNFEDEEEEDRVGSRVHYQQDKSTHCRSALLQPNSIPAKPSLIPGD